MSRMNWQRTRTSENGLISHVLPGDSLELNFAGIVKSHSLCKHLILIGLEG